MYIAHVRVRCFRNLAAVEISPGPDICVLYGANGQGKTNLIEAVYTLSNLQSFRTHRLQDLISFGDTKSLLEGKILGEKGSSQLRVTLEPRKRKARIDGKTPQSLSSYLSELHTVIFGPLDLNLARGHQELRRRFLDRAIFLADPSHLSRLRNYNRALKQRNALLRSHKAGIEAWDEQFVELAVSVHRARKLVLERLSPLIDCVHGEISGRPEPIVIRCEAPYAGEGDPLEGLHRLLREGRERDRRLGYTGVGPHRDAVRIRLGETDLQRHGSQGQLRTVALSFKLALLRWAREILGEEPVFLLDDPGSELDADRLQYLGRFLAQWPGQVMIAGTEKNSVPVPPETEQRCFRVIEGRLEEG